MSWYAYPLAFLAGMLLANGVPHFVHGASGTPFQSPFATPSGVGESSPLVNVYWGFSNIVGGIVLVVKLTPENTIGWIVLAAGALLSATVTAVHFGKVRRRPA